MVRTGIKPDQLTLRLFLNDGEPLNFHVLKDDQKVSRRRVEALCEGQRLQVPLLPHLLQSRDESGVGGALLVEGFHLENKKWHLIDL